MGGNEKRAIKNWTRKLWKGTTRKRKTRTNEIGTVETQKRKTRKRKKRIDDSWANEIGVVWKRETKNPKTWTRKTTRDPEETQTRAIWKRGTRKAWTGENRERKAI